MLSNNASQNSVTDIILQYNTATKKFEGHVNPILQPNSGCVVISFEDSSEIDNLIDMLSEFRKYVKDAYQFTCTVGEIKGGENSCTDVTISFEDRRKYSCN